LSANQRAYSIPEIIAKIAKIAKKAIRGRTVIGWRFRNAWIHATEVGLFFRDKDIHGRKDPHECGGTLPAWLFCIEVIVFNVVC